VLSFDQAVVVTVLKIDERKIISGGVRHYSWTFWGLGTHLIESIVLATVNAIERIEAIVRHPKAGQRWAKPAVYANFEFSPDSQEYIF
jgi:hypothetical protein